MDIHVSYQFNVSPDGFGFGFGDASLQAPRPPRCMEEVDVMREGILKMLREKNIHPTNDSVVIIAWQVL